MNSNEMVRGHGKFGWNVVKGYGNHSRIFAQKFLQITCENCWMPN